MPNRSWKAKSLQLRADNSTENDYIRLGNDFLNYLKKYDVSLDEFYSFITTNSNNSKIENILTQSDFDLFRYCRIDDQLFFFLYSLLGKSFDVTSDSIYI